MIIQILWAFALQHSSGSSSPAYALVLFKLIFLRVFFSGGVFSSQTPHVRVVLSFQQPMFQQFTNNERSLHSHFKLRSLFQVSFLKCRLLKWLLAHPMTSDCLPRSWIRFTWKSLIHENPFSREVPFLRRSVFSQTPVIYIYIYIYMYVYVHVCMHIYIYIYTHA